MPGLEPGHGDDIEGGHLVNAVAHIEATRMAEDGCAAECRECKEFMDRNWHCPRSDATKCIPLI